MVDFLKMREKLNKWMDEDQKIVNPTQRISKQREWWAYIKKNMTSIFTDCGDDKTGNYPTSSFAAWLLVQHMDAYPHHQRTFLNEMKRKVPKHVKLKFLEDRVNVNEWIMANYKKPEYYHNGKILDRPTVDVRNPKIFGDAGILANSQKEALNNALKYGNRLLVDAVKAKNARTQPSYRQGSE